MHSRLPVSVCCLSLLFKGKRPAIPTGDLVGLGVTLRMDSSKARIRRTAQEKRRIVELTLQPGMSVARVAQAEGVNSHQVFQ
jgi:hypothetical protein